MSTKTIRISDDKLSKLNSYATARGWSQRFVLDALVDSVEQCPVLQRLSRVIAGSEPVASSVEPNKKEEDDDDLGDLAAVLDSFTTDTTTKDLKDIL